MALDFGVFNRFWDKHPNHLPLLDLHESATDSPDWNLGKSLRLLTQIVANNPEPLVVEGIRLLLQDQDWRPHLVACFALLSVEPHQRKEVISRLWQRLARGSWVSPQILVVLSVIDEEFIGKATTIEANGFEVRYSGMAPTEHHTARGPLGATSASKKVIAAVHYLLTGSINDSDDSDSGGWIAQSWQEQLLPYIQNGRLVVAQG